MEPPVIPQPMNLVQPYFIYLSLFDLEKRLLENSLFLQIKPVDINGTSETGELNTVYVGSCIGGKEFQWDDVLCVEGLRAVSG